MNGFDRPDQLGAAHALQHITLHTGTQRLADMFVVIERGQDRDLHTRRPAEDFSGCIETVSRNLDVDEHDIQRRILGDAAGVGGGFALGNDGQSALRDDLCHPFPE